MTEPLGDPTTGNLALGGRHDHSTTPHPEEVYSQVYKIWKY